ncbi:MAG TPA: glycosyltransferase, partial [Acidobacteriaceae bacterium]|nr:glycosyltransferase [Acidobacteriaceae bacterium]
MVNALAFFATHGLGHYWKTHYADRTFRHAYRWNSFDIAMLVPYFVVMVILAFYGIHRYQLVWLYFRNKRKASHSTEPAARFDEGKLPFVTIQLPMFNEQYVVDRLIDACCRIEYPRDRFEIQVLDDSTDETKEVAAGVVARYAQGAEGLRPQPIHYLHRTNRYGYKAGALEEGLKTAKGELVAIFDADF